MSKALRIIGLIVMTFAVVSCAGSAYIAQLVVGATPQNDPVATDMKTAMITSAVISFGVFAVGATLFSFGTYRQSDNPRSKASKKQKVMCPACGERYTTKKLRCPACGEENTLQWSPSRQRRGLFDMLPFMSDLEGPQRAMMVLGMSIVALMALAAFFFSMYRL